jgi:hypothetical protein
VHLTVFVKGIQKTLNFDRQQLNVANVGALMSKDARDMGYGVWLETDERSSNESAKRYRPLREIAFRLLAEGRWVELVRQRANHYAVSTPRYSQVPDCEPVEPLTCQEKPPAPTPTKHFTVPHFPNYHNECQQRFEEYIKPLHAKYCQPTGTAPHDQEETTEMLSSLSSQVVRLRTDDDDQGED